ncbi:MAG: hypothetical protein AAGD47_07730 [Pseudomonadota bacterium]
MSPELPVWFDDLLAALLVTGRHVGAFVTHGGPPPLLLRQPDAGTLWASPEPAAYIGGTHGTGWCEVRATGLGATPPGPVLAVASGPSGALIDAMRAAGWPPDYVLSAPGVAIDGFLPLGRVGALHRRDGSTAPGGIEELVAKVAESSPAGETLIDALMGACAKSDGVLRTRLTPGGEVRLDLSPLACAGPVARAVVLGGTLPVIRGRLLISLPPLPPGALALSLDFQGRGTPPAAKGFTSSTPAPGRVVLCSRSAGMPPAALSVPCPAGWRLTRASICLPLPNWQPGDEIVADPLGQYNADPFGGEPSP